mmetsp:Transcript_13161/g.43400  ORF Transcript_13161/g.43400 Transcript_13161/m.43400 type:complete len:532 (+) Transcript_13161:4036-5631(+)
MLDHARRHLVRVHHHVKEAVARGHLHRGVVLGVAVEQHDERAVHPLDLVLLLDAAHRLQTAVNLARNRVLELLLRLAQAVAALREAVIELAIRLLEVAAPVLQLIALLLQRETLARGRGGSLPVLLQRVFAPRDVRLRRRNPLDESSNLAFKVAHLPLLGPQGRLVLVNLRLQPRVAFRHAGKLRRAALFLVELLELALALLDLRLQLALGGARCLELGLDGVEGGPHLSHLFAQIGELLLRVRARADVVAELLLQVFHVELELSPRLHRLLHRRFSSGFPFAHILRRTLNRALLALNLLQPRPRVRHALVHLGGGLRQPKPSLLHLVQLCARLLELLVVNRILQRSALLVQTLVFVQLLLLLVQLLQLVLHVPEHLLDLIALRLGVAEHLQRLFALVLVHSRPRNLFEEKEPLVVLHQRHRLDLALLHDIVRVAARKSRRLEQVDHLRLVDMLAVEQVLVLFEANRAPQPHLLPVHRQPVVGVVKDNLYVRLQHLVAGALVQERLALLGPHPVKNVVQNEPDAVEKVGLA